ncbi:MAG: glucosyl-3-phosphoglycerate synthase [Streptosporangiaceae bacterium]|nr:glucosyl-3-phosphoglycerate synthase [Streptosporangiaceae bacterium]MBV9854442.1 glucosyl-3-phosphoglycerate synthase [Streptosporangiaceae bacterium]
MSVWEWFERRSFHHKDFRELAGHAGKRPAVTLVLPARNVAETIGPILDTVARVHARTGVPDQVVVVDADSPDGTAGIARARGAEVYSENELLPDYGPAQGKGDAMWRSLSVATGDIVMFADADTTDFGEHFIYGTVGPMLADPAIQFCKAAYRRPFTQQEKSIADGGGRVTELTAKPLLNLFYPELAGFVQPLAGEFAVRRDLLVTLPFFTGYGVEIGLLIDVLSEVGLAAMAQADLGARQNRHQPLRDLTRMSSVVLRTMAKRVPMPERDLPAAEAPGLWALSRPEIYLHAVATEGGLRLDEYLNELIERPAYAKLSAPDDTGTLIPNGLW